MVNPKLVLPAGALVLAGWTGVMHAMTRLPPPGLDETMIRDMIEAQIALEAACGNAESPEEEGEACIMAETLAGTLKDIGLCREGGAKAFWFLCAEAGYGAGDDDGYDFHGVIAGAAARITRHETGSTTLLMPVLPSREAESLADPAILRRMAEETGWGGWSAIEMRCREGGGIDGAHAAGATVMIDMDEEEFQEFLPPVITLDVENAGFRSGPHSGMLSITRTRHGRLVALIEVESADFVGILADFLASSREREDGDPLGIVMSVAPDFPEPAIHLDILDPEGALPPLARDFSERCGS